MTGSIALDVVIGLVFVYLLYSLLATVISEIIATKLGLRARNLKEAVDRMLNDATPSNVVTRFIDSMRLMKNPNNPAINEIYNHPEIKYLGSSGLFKNPSAFQAISFSRTFLSVLLEDEAITAENISRRLTEQIRFGSAKLGKETSSYIRMLWRISYGDVNKFQVHLEGWFDRTMQQATEWYKRKIQVVLLVIGFCMAALFNADTFVIVQKLSVDKDARDKMVALAQAYVAAHPNDSGKADKVKEATEEEIHSAVMSANTTLGLGGWLADTVTLTLTKNNELIKDSRGVPLYEPLDRKALSDDEMKKAAKDKFLTFTFCRKVGYLFQLTWYHLGGFLLTALAISLGSPFWFDLLNKLMKLRTSLKDGSTEPKPASSGTEGPIEREA